MQFSRRARTRPLAFLFSLVLLAVAWAATPAGAQSRGSSTGIYAGAITIDADTGEVVNAENADVTNPPASMTKLMTFAIVHDKLADGTLTLQTPVQITAADAKMGGTQVYLDPRETFPVEELLYAMMIQSANDAAHALARTAAGSVPAFVELMNAKARQLGMHRTTFRTPHGLPPPSRRIDEGDLTTPRDFAILCRHLVQHTDVLKYTAVRERPFGVGRAQGPQLMRNHNNLLGKVPGVDGLKTGYTAAAGYCLSATAERNGRRLIVVIVGSFGPNRQIDKGKARDLKVVELLEQGFAAAPGRGPKLALPVVSTAPGAKTAAPAAGAAPAKDEIPTVKTQPAPATDAASTPKEPAVIFRLPPLPKS